MADLPIERATPAKSPFTYASVDCFGSFVVRRGRERAKRYGVLFICLSIPATHMERAHSLETDVFLNALRQFISRNSICYVLVKSSLKKIIMSLEVFRLRFQEKATKASEYSLASCLYF